MELRVLLTTTVVVLMPALATPSRMAGQSAPKNVQDTACRPAALHDFSRVGCPDPHAVETRHVELSIKNVHRPLPSGVVILEVGIDLNGKVVSACVMRGVRDDFDKAAQAAALASQWKLSTPYVRARGYVLTITECTPEPACKQRPLRGK